MLLHNWQHLPPSETVIFYKWQSDKHAWVIKTKTNLYLINTVSLQFVLENTKTWNCFHAHPHPNQLRWSQPNPTLKYPRLHEVADGWKGSKICCPSPPGTSIIQCLHWCAWLQLRNHTVLWHQEKCLRRGAQMCGQSIPPAGELSCAGAHVCARLGTALPRFLAKGRDGNSTFSWNKSNKPSKWGANNEGVIHNP